MKFDEFVWNAHLFMKELPFNEVHILGAFLIIGFGYAAYRAAKEEV